jgi:hypothetical protein
MTKARDLANFVSTGNPLADGILAVADISDLTASAAELNTLDGITASTAELNILDGVTASTAQLNELGTFAGTFTLPVSDGTANQYLKTDGSGNLSFGTVATEPFSNNAALAQVQATALCF